MDPQTTVAASDSISQLIAGGGLVLSGGLILKLLELAQRVWSSKNQRMEITPSPLEVKGRIKGEAIYALKSDNDDHHENIFARLKALETDNGALKESINAIKSNVADSKKQIDRLVWNLIPGSRKGLSEIEE